MYPGFAVGYDRTRVGNDSPRKREATVKILDDLLASLDTGAEVRDIRQGLFHTAVLTRSCGLASTLTRSRARRYRI